MKPDWKRLAPMGIDGQSEWVCFLLGIGFSAVWSLGFVFRYLGAYWSMFAWYGKEFRLEPEAAMKPFLWLLDNALLGYGVLFLGAVVLAFYHYRTHLEGSKSMYVMKRLADPLELHRRCWGVPVLVMGADALAAGVTVGVYALIYFLATPSQCLP